MNVLIHDYVEGIKICLLDFSKGMKTKDSLNFYLYEDYQFCILLIKVFALFSLCCQIGNWSRWLTDLFDIDDSEGGIELDGDNKVEYETSFKVFHLLNALSDLMMLPFEMLSDRSIRKEVKSCNFNDFN